VNETAIGSHFHSSALKEEAFCPMISQLSVSLIYRIFSLATFILLLSNRDTDMYDFSCSQIEVGLC